jgi:hypothetical protein
MVQGASVTSPTESLKDLVLKWFVFDSQSNVIAPPYLKPELGVNGDLSNFFGNPCTHLSLRFNVLAPSSVWSYGALETMVDVPSYGTNQS